MIIHNVPARISDDHSQRDSPDFANAVYTPWVEGVQLGGGLDVLDYSSGGGNLEKV